MYCVVEGTVVAAKMQRPADGKPYRSVMVLQQVNDDAQLVKVKDMDLKEYGQGESFAKFCRVSNWSFDGKSGMTVYIVHRENGVESGLDTSKGDVV